MWGSDGKIVTRVGCAEAEIQPVRHDGHGFDFDLRAILDQGANFDQGHRRIVASDHLAVGRTDRRQGREIFKLVRHIPGHADKVLGLGTAFGEDRNDVLQCLARLAREIVGFELLFGSPANLAGDHDDGAARGDAVRVPFGLFPPRRKQCLHEYPAAEPSAADILSLK
jgi:hypothetical protein